MSWIEGWMITLFLAGVLYVAREAVNHFKLKQLADKCEKIEERHNAVETEQHEIISALNRSYVSREELFREFVHRKEFSSSLGNLEEKLLEKMEHLNTIMQRTFSLIEATVKKGD